MVSNNFLVYLEDMMAEMSTNFGVSASCLNYKKFVSASAEVPPAEKLQHCKPWIFSGFSP